MLHSLDICQAIAHRMKRPGDLYEFMNESIKRQTFVEDRWLDFSFADGLSGIASFYASMDSMFPEERWHEVSHQYLSLMAFHFEENGLPGYSLLSGLSGFCFAVHLCSKKETRYRNLQAKLEAILLERIEKEFLVEAKKCLYHNLETPPRLYNLSEGISGAFAYLLWRKDDGRMYQLILDCVTLLIDLFNREYLIKETSVPPWYVSSKNQLAEEEKTKFSEGSFILGMPFGITGCLSALSLIALEGIKVPRLEATITKIAYWLKNQQVTNSHGETWLHTVACEVEKKGEGLKVGTGEKEQLNRETWWSGTPCVARALYLAGKATRDLALMEFGEKSCMTLFAKPMKEWNMMATSFMHGRAGVLTTTYRMAKDSQNPFLFKQVNTLENDLKGFYKPDSPFGFKMVTIDPPGTYRWVDHPGLFSGAIGVALSLLLVQEREELHWDRAFLVN